MPEIPSANEITHLLSALVPGMIVVVTRARAVVGPDSDYKEKLLTYAFFSLAYNAVISPLFYVKGGCILPFWFWSAMQYFIIPLLIGVVAAYEAQKDWIAEIASKCKLNLLTSTEAAWDYAFSYISEDTYVLVTLKNGAKVAGRMAKPSLASTSKKERDLLIGEMWNPTEPEWKKIDPTRRILICGGEISAVELIGG